MKASAVARFARNGTKFTCKAPLRASLSLTRRTERLGRPSSLRGALQAAETRRRVSFAEEDVAGRLVLGRCQGAYGALWSVGEELWDADMAGDEATRRAAADTGDSEKSVASAGGGCGSAERV